ncbi:MAG: methyltransferase domain-containing protein [Acidobacteria bacterium]|nr:methyltransferase domain-containing protein [Acidobacteriota bacterium]
MSRQQYIPALRYHGLTPLYDSILRGTMRETLFKRRLIEQARIEKGHRILDLGCGTATLTLLVRQTCPKAEVVGLDPDAGILGIARAKAARAGLHIALHRAMAYALPYADDSFDRVLSSLVFHHLSTLDKRRALREVLRVLRPGGELHIADWGKPQNVLLRAAFLLIQFLDGFETTADNVRGLLPELIRAAGFHEVRVSACYFTPFGTLCLYQAQKIAFSR